MKISRFDWEPDFLLKTIHGSIYSFDSMALLVPTSSPSTMMMADGTISVISNVTIRKNMECARNYSFLNRILMGHDGIVLKKPNAAHSRRGGLFSNDKKIVGGSKEQSQQQVSKDTQQNISHRSTNHTLYNNLSYVGLVYAAIVYKKKQTVFKAALDPNNNISVHLLGLNSIFGFGHTLNVLDWDCGTVVTFYCSDEIFYRYMLNKK